MRQRLYAYIAASPVVVFAAANATQSVAAISLLLWRSCTQAIGRLQLSDHAERLALLPLKHGLQLRQHPEGGLDQQVVCPEPRSHGIRLHAHLLHQRCASLLRY